MTSGLLPYWITLSLVAASPLFFGAVYPWTYAGMALCAGLALLLLVPALARYGTDADPRLRALSPSIVLYLLVLAWAMVQCVPGLASGRGHEFWAAFSRILQADVPDTITISPSLTLYAIIRMASYGCIFLVIYWYSRDVRRARQIVTVVAIASVAYAAYGLIAYFTGNKTILWYRKPSYVFDLTAVFVNRNNFAAYAGLGLLCCVTVLHWRLRDGSARLGGQLRPPQVIGMLLVLPNALLLMGCLVLATALLLSHSRGGAGTTLLGLLVLGTCLSIGRNLSWRAIAGLVLTAILASMFVLTVSGEVTLTRMARLEGDFTFRIDIYDLSLRMLADRPLSGFGLGTFEDVFRVYRTPLFPERYTMAHNSFLELAVDIGVPATLLFLVALAVPVARCTRGVALRRWEVAFPALGLAATVQIGTHSLIDFPLQLPAIAATYSALLAVAMAQSWPRNEIATAPPGPALR